MLAGRAAQAALEEAPGIAVGDEAHVVAVRLVRDAEAAIGGFLADLVLGGVAEREHGPPQLLTGQHGQHVRLVLSGVDAAHKPRQLRCSGNRLEPRVMASADRVEAERHRPVEHSRELDLLVAAQARIRRVAARVLVDEVLDDILVEPVGHVPDVERNADDVRGPARVAGVFERAAATRPAPVRARVARQRQVDAGDVVASLGGPRRRDGRVDAAGHGSKHTQSSHFTSA